LSEIPPGKTAKERFAVQFPDAGSHEITAKLESDAVATDNYRYAAIDLPSDVSVLVIDGDAEAKDAKYLSLAMAPGGSVRTGIRPQVETPRYLSMKPVDGFAAIFLTNVERLDASAIDALEKYVAAGGGVAFFLGDRCDPKYFNEVLYRNGTGIFPAPLGRKVELVVDRLEPAPDVQAGQHFIFRVFGEKRNSFLQTVTVARYFALLEGWHPPADRSIRVAANLRNSAPLVVERNFGRGRAMAFLTTAGPAWNNWAQNPSYVVVIQDMVAYLSQRAGRERSRLVGSPLELTLDPTVYQPQIRFNTPRQGDAGSLAVNAVPNVDGALKASLTSTDWSGFYEAQLVKMNGATETRRYAMNVDSREGDLAVITGQELAVALGGVPYKFEQASAFQLAVADIAGNNLAETILYLLVALLIVEQILAWSASYHPARRSASQGGKP
jgi:hypothetical protein